MNLGALVPAQVMALLLSVVVASPRAACARAEEEAAVVVRVDAGSLRGSLAATDPGVRVYRGVPYAAPPVGSLRWRPPAAGAPWDGVRDATSFAPPCVQVERPGRPDAAVLGSEDCLYLNVWTAAAPGERRPVLVWIHGGGMRRGNASDPGRDGAVLARHGLVVVSVAYRLGAMGFFAHPLLSVESEHDSSGSYGLLDAVAALRFIERNAGAFGGDPRRVTIFGQSGGARIVQYLQATPLARGLFHRVIAHSSGTFDESSYLRDPPPGGESAEAAGARWAEAMLDSPADDPLAALRALPVERVVATVEGLLPHYSVPVDGWALPDTTLRLFGAGRQADVPVLLGWNANEAAGMADSAGAPADAPEYSRRVAEEYGDAAPGFAALYPPGDDPRAAFLRGYGVQTFGWNMWAWARSMQAVRAPAFYYHFERGPSTPGSGATARHGAELAYVFGNLDRLEGAVDADRARSELLIGYWSAFAAGGDPNGEGRPRWAPHTTEGDETLVFGEGVELRGGVRAAELDFFERFYRARLDRVNSGAPP